MLPVERYDKMKKELDNRGSCDTQKDQEPCEKENDVNGSVERQNTNMDSTIITKVERLLPSGQSKKASAIFFTLSSSDALDGIDKNEVFHFLLHSQNEIHRRPANICFWYNLIVQENVPLHLFSNDGLRRQLGRLKHCDSDQSDEERGNTENTLDTTPTRLNHHQFRTNVSESHEQRPEFNKGDEKFNHKPLTCEAEKGCAFVENREGTATKKRRKNWIKL